MKKLMIYLGFIAVLYLLPRSLSYTLLLAKRVRMKRRVLVISRYYTRCLLALFRKSHELEIFTSCSTSPSDW